MQIKKHCKITAQHYPVQKPTYRVNIPIAFVDIMGIDSDTRFEMEIADEDTIVLRRLQND